MRAPRRRIWILARARPFVRIAACLDLAVQVAGLAADAEDFLKLVIVGFDRWADRSGLAANAGPSLLTIFGLVQVQPANRFAPRAEGSLFP
jgi:hypothetical protein